MIEQLDMDKVGIAIVGLFTSIGTFFAGRQKRAANDVAEIAADKASASISDAEGTLYTRLREEIDALRNDVSRLRSDLDTERRHSRQLELYVWQSDEGRQRQRLVAEKGITVPPFVGDSAPPQG